SRRFVFGVALRPSLKPSSSAICTLGPLTGPPKMNLRLHFPGPNDNFVMGITSLFDYAYRYALWTIRLRPLPPYTGSIDQASIRTELKLQAFSLLFPQGLPSRPLCSKASYPIWYMAPF